MTDEAKQTTGKALNIRISEDTHKRLKVLCGHSGKTIAELLTVLIDREWAVRSSEIGRQ